MVAVVAVKHGDWNNLHPLAVDNIAMKATIIAVLVYSMVVIIHEKFNSDIGDHSICATIPKPIFTSLKTMFVCFSICSLYMYTYVC